MTKSLNAVILVSKETDSLSGFPLIKDSARLEDQNASNSSKRFLPLSNFKFSIMFPAKAEWVSIILTKFLESINLFKIDTLLSLRSGKIFNLF